MDADFLSPVEVLATVPGLKKTTLSSWGTKCSPLGRTVGTKPDPNRKGWRLYCMADVLSAWSMWSGPVPAGFLQQRDVLQEFPRLSPTTLNAWKVCCPLLDHPVDTRPHPRNPKYSLFSIADVRSACSQMEGGPLPDQFRDGDEIWLWIQRVRAADQNDTREKRMSEGKPGPYRIGINTLYRWREKPGCPYLNGRQVSIRHRHAWGHRNGRDYVRVSELEQILAGRAAAPTKSPPPGWADWHTAAAGVGPGVLARFGDPTSEEDSRIAESHPSLGRPIRTRGGSRKRVYYWNDDLQTILTKKPPADVWATRRDAMDGYQLTEGEINEVERLGCVEIIPFPLPPRAGQRVLTKHYRRADLTRFVERRERRRAGGDQPDTVADYKSDRRRYVDPATGRVYWPLAETCRLAGVLSIEITKFRRHGCPHLPGSRRIDAQQVTFTWRRARAEQWVYSEEDATSIWRATHGTKGRRRSKPAGRRRGRPSRADNEADDAFVARQRASGLKLAEFAAQENVPLAEAKRIAGRVRVRASLARRETNRAGKRRQAD